ILSNPTDFSYSSARFYYRAGEFVRVSRIDGNTVHLTKPVYDTYAAASIDLYRMDPIRCGVSNMTIRCTPNQSGIKVSFGTDLRFNNLEMSGSYVTHLSLSRCYNVDIDHVKAFDATPLTGSHGHYGITIANCQRVRLNSVDLETTRH